jgi:group I intron endonuclease
MINEKGEEVGIIYGWYNTKSEKWYVGQTIDEEGRFKRHIYNAINKKDKTYFHRAIRKYGLDNWVYCVLEDNILRDNLNMREMYWVEEFDSFYNGYNLTAGGGNTIFSEEVKEKLKGKIRSEETRKRISNACKGKHLSDETKEKLSKAHKGQIPWNKGKCLSDEHREKISEAKKGLIGLRGSKNHLYGKPAVNRKPVSKYDLNGNFIKKYDCMTDALKENPKACHIWEVCNGKFKQTGGFIWKYA